MRTKNWFVYTASVTNVYPQMIVEWLLISMRTEALSLQGLNQAIVCASATIELILNWRPRLREHGIAASTGIISDSYDLAFAGNVNGAYKIELIYNRV